MSELPKRLWMVHFDLKGLQRMTPMYPQLNPSPTHTLYWDQYHTVGGDFIPITNTEWPFEVGNTNGRRFYYADKEEASRVQTVLKKYKAHIAGNM